MFIRLIGTLAGLLAISTLAIITLTSGLTRLPVDAGQAWRIRLISENGLTHLEADPHTGATMPIFTPADLPTSASTPREASLSPDNRWLITEERFANLAFNEFYLYDLQQNDGQRRRIFDGEFFDVNFYWSADSRYAAYALGSRRTSLWLLDTVTQTEQFMLNLTDISHVSWSPDQTRLALQYRQGIVIIDLAGQMLHRIGHQPDLVGVPTWAADHILYYGCSTTERPLIQICAVDLRHGLTARLLDLAPALPDGGFIRTLDANSQGQVIFKLDGLIANGEILTYDATPRQLINLSARFGWQGTVPRWQE